MEVHCIYTHEDSTMKLTKHFEKGGATLFIHIVCMYEIIPMKSSHIINVC
jgi:hypothetical protein